MGIKKIDREQWEGFFEEFSNNFMEENAPEPAEMLVLTRTFGYKDTTERILLKGINYDSETDSLDVLVEDFERRTLHPNEIYVYELESGRRTIIDILQSDGEEDLIEIL